MSHLRSLRCNACRNRHWRYTEPLENKDCSACNGCNGFATGGAPSGKVAFGVFVRRRRVSTNRRNTMNGNIECAFIGRVASVADLKTAKPASPG